MDEKNERMEFDAAIEGACRFLNIWFSEEKVKVCCEGRCTPI